MPEFKIEEYPNFDEYEIAMNFARFQDDIENYKRVIKKLKRKKIDFDVSFFSTIVRHLQGNQEKYFEMMKQMFATNDADEKEFLISELSFMIYNRFGCQQNAYDYEMKVTHDKE